MINHVISADLVRLRPCGALTVNSSLSCSLYRGENGGVSFLGWSTNLQSSHGVTLDFRQELGRWLELARGVDVDDQGACICMPVGEANIDPEGYVVRERLLRVRLLSWSCSKGGLETVLRKPLATWAIMAEGFLIRIKLDEREAVLNADTKRTAVAEYLKDARNRGPEFSWSNTA